MPIISFSGIDFVTAITTVFWIWMLIDCVLTKRFKVGWFIFILFTHIVGAVIYYFVDCSRRNPLEALSYYVQYVNGVFQQKPAPTPQPPASQASRPNYQSYPSYQGGYQARQPESPPAEEAPAYHPQPEYEQPTATYPEMPPQQQ